MSACSVPGCETPKISLGLCEKHYYRLRRHGTTELPPKPTLEERFWAKVDRRSDDECWVWLGAKWQGYGAFRGEGGRKTKAHRTSYELLVGPIPEGLTLDHLCRNPPCVNPAHLEPVTARVNTLRGETLAARQAAQTHCKNGHPFNEENTISRRRGRGGRDCLACQKEASRRSYLRKREAMA